jgi:hypothetical protein
MLPIQFWKVSAAGNDFVMIDNRRAIIQNNFSEISRMLCDRHNGIGAMVLFSFMNCRATISKCGIIMPTVQGRPCAVTARVQPCFS